MIEPVRSIKYDGTALPEDSDVETLYDSTDQTNPVPEDQLGSRWFTYFISHDQDGTVTLEFSIDGGTNWSLAYTSGTLSGQTVATDPADSDEIFIEGMKHIRVRWTNGGTTQTAFVPVLAIATQRAASGI